MRLSAEFSTGVSLVGFTTVTSRNLNPSVPDAITYIRKGYNAIFDRRCGHRCLETAERGDALGRSTNLVVS
jgi:hypothetical protein